MHCSPSLVFVATMLLDAQFAARAGDAQLESLSSADLHKHCLAYVQSQQSEGGLTCSAYIRGFLDGSQRVAVRDKDVRQGESFTERALRTRFGKPMVPNPDYCVSSTTSMQEFVTRMLSYAAQNPPEVDVSASALIYGTLSRFYRCPP